MQGIVFGSFYALSYPLLAKDFAMGFRVQHSQKDIDTALYGEISEELREKLGASAYKISHQAKHRSFLQLLYVSGRICGKLFFGGGKTLCERHEL